MKASELIKSLEQLIAQHGDLQIGVWTYDDIDEADVVEFDDTILCSNKISDEGCFHIY